MATFGTIKTRIADRYKGSSGASFLATIGTAINEAIEYYSYLDVWFREVTLSLTLTVGDGDLTANAAWPTDFWYFDEDSAVRIYYASKRYAVTKVSPGEFDTSYNDASTGMPRIYREQSGKVELLPLPDQAYTCEIKYIKKYAELTDDANTNDWLVYAPQLIQARALSQLFLGQGHETGGMHDYWKRQEDEQLTELKRVNARRKATGNLQMDC